MINMQLAERLNLTEESIIKIKELQDETKLIVKEMSNCPDHHVKNLYKTWEMLQFKLQDLWGFERNASFHRSWYLPRCSCPKIDNDDNYPTGPCYFTKGCLVHG